ncbi:hypothetical protein [Wolbachia endosymbiont of Armadillidium arcangelii]|uniref:Uncharacterized protein n=1 Tax=Wolbachia endosymbiont of Armadillidium arcangelii TaxID=3158571 RepID=A0AAU7Q3S3_9RICK
MMKGFRLLINQIRLSWISLILKIKSFFQIHNTHHKTTASNGNDHTRKISVENKIETKGNEIDLEDIWYDALEEQELDREEYFDAVESLDEQENSERKEYDENKCYSLQDGLQEKNEFDRATHTLTLAFEIEKPLLDFDLSKFKLCKLKQNGGKYTFTLEDNQKNRIELHSEYLNMYFPKYFEKHSKKRAYTELFSQEENGIRNDIIIPLQLPKEIGILTEKFGWMNFKKANIQSHIPDFPKDIDLKSCKDHVNCFLNSNNTISLSLTSAKVQCAAILLGIPTETNWPIKDVLVRGEFANTVNKHIYKQPRVEEVNSDPESFEVVDVENVYQSQRFQPNM